MTDEKNPTQARMFQADFTGDEFSRRRAKVCQAIGPSAVALIQGAPKNATHDLFRQTNDFYYLCGVEVPHAYLLLDGKSGGSALFLPHRTRQLTEQEGELLSPENAEAFRERLGVDEILGIESLARRLEGVTRLFTPFRQGEVLVTSWDTLQRAQQDSFSDPWDGHLDRTHHFAGLLRGRCPKAELCDLAPQLDEQRLIKSPQEIDLLREAGKLAARGLMSAMRCTRPGVMEYQLDAVLRYEYLIGGARDVAYRSIVAGGPNSWYGHYNANDCPLRDGDLLLVDAGPEYRYYASDITRIWPVSGTYTPDQRQLYGLITEYHKLLLTIIRSGRSEMELREEAAREMAPTIQKMRFSKEIYRQAALRTLDFAHLTHSVGLAVHDVGTYKRGGPIAPGVVFALDPQLIIPEEKLYIRVEDTVVVTEKGVENLTSLAPLDLTEIEKVMREKGMLQAYPPGA